MNYGVILLIVVAIIFGILTIIGLMSPIMINNNKSDNNNIFIYLCILIFILVLLFWAIFNIDNTIKKDLKNNNVTIKEIQSDMNILKSNTGYIYHDDDDNRNIIYVVNIKDNKVITINKNCKYIQYVLVDNKKDIHVEKCTLSSDNIKPITFDCYRLYLTKDLMNEFKK